jgi:hypothetical protein
MEAMLRLKLEKWFDKNQGETMEVDIVENGENKGIKLFASFNELEANFTDNGTIYFPI